MATDISKQDWTKTVAEEDYLVSTRLELVSRDFVQAAFASEDTYWAKPLDRTVLESLLENSVTLGLYKVLPAIPPARSAETPDSPRTPSPAIDAGDSERLQQIGMARLVTDRITTAYLTDVFLVPEYRGKALGKWVVQCVDEVFKNFPAMRRTFLVTSPDVGARFYKQELGFWDVSEEKHQLACLTRRFFKMD
ncbi:hypothetical protein LTR09_006780 [Extremus antarcticus]|uniref:N-acetyltransferase domain-containing protein n=1 Tax=Extremus antarcticus TaxID=702011 RepID=A0AAJ0DKV7_9PEZI|nr:hypothetical protein LTR09_006780 [Extremus antarcticus]